MKARTPALRMRLGVLLTLLGALVLAIPAVSSAVDPLPGASVTVCQVSGSASAPSYAQVTLSVDQVAAFLNQNPGSFVGSCPAGGGGTSPGPLPGASVSVCQVTGSASSPSYAQVNVAVDQVTAFLNQNPGSFVGTCPATPPPSGGGGGLPSASVSICQVTGSAGAQSFAQVNVALDQVAAFLN